MITHKKVTSTDLDTVLVKRVFSFVFLGYLKQYILFCGPSTKLKYV